MPVDATFSAGQYAELAHAEIDGLLAAGQRPIVVGGTGLYLRAALTELSLDRRRPRAFASAGPPSSSARGPGGAARGARRARAVGGRRDRPGRPPADRPRARAARRGRARAAAERESELWTDAVRRPTLLIGLVMEREQLYARIDARVERDARRGRRGRGAPRQRRGRVAHRAQGARVRRAAGRRRRGDEAPDPQLRPPPADVDAQARRRERDRHDRPRVRPRSRRVGGRWRRGAHGSGVNG